MTQPIAPCLWFDGNAEDAVNYYVWCDLHTGEGRLRRQRA